MKQALSISGECCHEVIYRGGRAQARDSDQQARGNLPPINQQSDTAISQWQKINDELEGDKGLDLVRRLMMEDRSR